MAITATITWNFAPGSYGTILEYRESFGNGVWIKPTSPANPTLDNEYPLLIDENKFYDVRLTNIGRSGPCISVTKQIISYSSGSICCPATYSLSLDGTYCYKYIDLPPTEPTATEPLIKKSDVVYGTFGTLIYDLGFNPNGSGVSTQIVTSNPFWINDAPTNNTKGPLNRTAVWSTTTLSFQTIGYAVCINAPVAKTYYFGVGADNSVIARLDGTEILNMDANAMGIYLSANGYPGTGPDATFKFWHVYPIELTAGFHVLELIGYNDSSVAAFGAQIYNATQAQLAAVVDSSGLIPYLMFSSETEVGNPVQLGSNGIGYSCPSGYSLILCDGSPKCRQILTSSTISCSQE